MERRTDREIFDFYENGAEIGRLERGLGQVEGFRTKELLKRFLAPLAAQSPEGSLRILDVGGGIGYYANWLAGLGHRVEMIELAPAAVEYARAHQEHSYRAEVGNALSLPETMDVVLLLGPLYHLREKAERKQALAEARRVLKPGGLCVAAGISRFSSATWAVSTYGARNEFLGDETYFHMLEGEIGKGLHDRPAEYPDFLASAYFHLPEELRAELAEAGFSQPELYAVEGCIWICPTPQEKWEDPAAREPLLRLLRMTEQEPSLLGISPHFLAVGKKP